MPEPRPGSQKQGVGEWAGKGEKSMRDHERGLRRRRERRRGARDARHLRVTCLGNRVRLSDVKGKGTSKDALNPVTTMLRMVKPIPQRYFSEDRLEY